MVRQHDFGKLAYILDDKKKSSFNFFHLLLANGPCLFMKYRKCHWSFDF
jgi:hypothetical protein